MHQDPKGTNRCLLPSEFFFFCIFELQSDPALKLSAFLLNPQILTGLFGVSGFSRNAQSHSGLGLCVSANSASLPSFYLGLLV